MKLLVFPVWASLTGVTVHAATRSLTSAFLSVPEPSTAAMLILGICAIVVGISGRRRGARPERPAESAHES